MLRFCDGVEVTDLGDHFLLGGLFDVASLIPCRWFFGYWWRTFKVRALDAVAKLGVTLAAIVMADAVVLQAIVLLAIAPSGHVSFKDSFLLITGSLSNRTIIILALVVALADRLVTGEAILAADAIVLTTGTLLAVASVLWYQCS